MKADAEGVAGVQGCGIVYHVAILTLDDAKAARQHGFRIEMGEAATEPRQNGLTLQAMVLRGALGTGLQGIQIVLLLLNAVTRRDQALLELGHA
jgi:hypothetical protein